MKADFWHKKWQQQDIGFDQAVVNPLLAAHASALGLGSGSRVFVPLCGKSIDMVWLLEQGFHLVGVELSEAAVEQFFNALKIKPEVWNDQSFKRYSAQNIEILVGDYFQLTAGLLGDIDAIYDRASLVALPEEMRSAYAEHMITICQNAPQLLITFVYDQAAQAGPPFSISATEIKQHYGTAYQATLLASVAVRGGLKGGCDADEQIWLLRCRSLK